MSPVALRLQPARPPRAALRAVLLVTAAVAAAACSAGERRDFARTVAADPRGQVAITNVAGSVTVTGWDRSDVDVKGRLGADVERVDVVRDGQRVTVKVILPRGNVRDGEATLDIHVPRASALELNVVSADITTRAVAGGLRVSAVSGNLNAETDAAPVAVRTVSGDVVLAGRGQGTETRVETVSGDVRVDRVAGRLETQTVSGDVKASVEPLQGARVRSTSGDVQLAGRIAGDASVEVETVSGDISLRFPGGNFGYEAKSFSGDLTTCFGAKATTKEYGPGSTLDGKLGTGAARVRVRAMSGDVAICDR